MKKVGFIIDVVGLLAWIYFMVVLFVTGSLPFWVVVLGLITLVMALLRDVFKGAYEIARKRNKFK